MFVPYNPYHSDKNSSKKSIMARTSLHSLRELLKSRMKKLPRHPTKSNLYNSAVRSHLKIPMMSDDDAMCAKRFPELAEFSKEQLVDYLKLKGVNTAGMAKIDACHLISVSDNMSLEDVKDVLGAKNLGVKGRKSNRPKSRKSCMKRHMKWNSVSKRCNKKSLKK